MHPPALADTWTLLVRSWGRRTLQTTTYKAPVYDLHRRVALEGEMYRWETGPPHEQYDAAKIKAIAERCSGRRKVPCHMAACK